MKRLFTLLFLITVLVGGAKAAKLYVNTTENNNWWTNVRIYAYNSETDNNGWNYAESGVVTESTTLFGKSWYVFDMESYSNAIVQYFETSNHNISNQTTDITGINHDRFVILKGDSEKDNGKYTWYENGYTCRNNIDNNWDATSCNMTVVDANTLTYTLTKSAITSAAADKIWFRILNQEGQIYPQSEGTSISIASSTTTYKNNWDGTNASFGIDIPQYDYDKIVITASLSGSQWKISADAYISKTISAVGIATFGSAANVDFSKATPAGLTAKKGKVGNGGKITWTETTTLYGGEGALLEGTANTYSIPVAASAEADTDHNDLVAITTETQLAQNPESNYTSFILTKPDGESEYGFYMVNSEGSWCGAGTAYLKVSNSLLPNGANIYYPLVDNDENEDVTSINTIAAPQTKSEYIYNLAGQRVGNNYKGIMIQNGKKYIVK